MRQRAEDELRVAEGNVVAAHVGQLTTANAHGRAALLIRCREGERETGMSLDESTELAPRVSAGAEHSNWNLVHA